MDVQIHTNDLVSLIQQYTRFTNQSIALYFCIPMFDRKNN